MTKLALSFPGLNNSTFELDENLKSIGVPVKDKWQLSGLTITELINKLLPLIFFLSGITVFVMLIVGGFSIFTSAGNPEKIKKGQGIIVNALIGLTIIFAAYWIVELLQLSLGINIFGTPSTPSTPPPSCIPIPCSRPPCPCAI